MDDADVLGRCEAEAQTNLGIAHQHLARHLRGGAHQYLEAHPWIVLLKLRAHARHEFIGEGIRGGDAHGTAAQALQRVNRFDGLLGLEADAACVLREDVSGRRGHHAARVAFEQRGAELGFEAGDLPADGRHRHMQALRGEADRSALHDFMKVAQGSVLQLGGGGHGRARDLPV